MTAFSRILTAFARAFFVAAVLVMLPAPLALAQEDGSRPATKADILHLEEAGKRRDTKLDAVTANILRLEEAGKRRDAKLDALIANTAELNKNVLALVEKMSSLNEKVEAQGRRLDNMQNSLNRLDNTIPLGLLGIIAAMIGAGWWVNRKSAAEHEDSLNSRRTNRNLAIGPAPNDLIASAI